MSVKDNKAIYMRCDCGCCVLKISKWAFDEDDCGYDIAVLDSRYDHKANGVLNRLKRAANALFGRPVYFNDVSLTHERYDRLIQQMIELRDSEERE